MSQRGDLAGAEVMQRESLAMQRKPLGNVHPHVAVLLSKCRTHSSLSPLYWQRAAI